MKLFVLAFAVLAASSVADAFYTSEWGEVRPVTYYPKFWDNKAPELRPPAKFFENYENPTRNAQTRIVGGQQASRYQFPYQCALVTFLPSLGGSGFCGGSLIGTRTVLTAAHCVDGGSNGTATFGAHYWREVEPNQQRINFLSPHIFIHPEWNALLIRNDVALVVLPFLVNLIPNIVRAAILPTLADRNYDFANEDAVASGWGIYSQEGNASPHLRYVYDNVITVPQCQVSTIGTATAQNICMTGTQNRGVCNGDSGGPLTVRRGGESMHVGIASFVVASCHNTLPSVFVRTTSYLEWIVDNKV